MTILLLETATPTCSAAIDTDGAIVAERHSSDPNAHSTRLSVFVDEMMKEAQLSPSNLDAVCVSSGPGSYTGLRIGVSAAKGFCYALGIPLLSVPTPKSMAALYFAKHPDYQGLVCPMIDARRMECYTALYRRSDIDGLVEEVREIRADIVEPHLYDEYLDAGEVCFVGDGAEKTRPLLSVHPNARYVADFAIAAEGMSRLAHAALANHVFENVAYFEPFYLKDFVAKKSIVRGLY